jgi:hypothetical protein
MPAILGNDVRIIGQQIMTESGPLDLLGIDRNGNLVIIELKRDKLPREALVQAIDYASDIATWDIDKVNEVCEKFSEKTLDEFIEENFEDVDSNDFAINVNQTILLVGFSVDKALGRMIEWLSDNYNMSINALILKYIKSSSGDELLSKTSIINEEIAKEKGSKKHYVIEMSDDKGNYDHNELKNKLKEYLSKKLWSARRMKEIMLPYLLNKDIVTRAELKEVFLNHKGDLGGVDPKQAGIFIALISSQLGHKKKDYLRQVINYEYPNYHWEKDNFQITNEYKELVKEVLNALS